MRVIWQTSLSFFSYSFTPFIHLSIQLRPIHIYFLFFSLITALPLFRPLPHLQRSSTEIPESFTLSLLSSLAFIKPQMGCHASPSSLSCPVWKARPFRGDGGMRKRPEHSTREEGWPLCLHLPGATAPLRHWCGIMVPERSRDRESAGRRWRRETSQVLLRANPQEFGVFSLFDHILEPLNDVFGSKHSDPCIPMLRQRLTCSTFAVLQHRGVPYEWNPSVYVCVEAKAKITNLLLLKASCCAVLYLNRMPAKVFNVSARQHPLCAAAFLLSVELFLACLCFLLLSAPLTPPNGHRWHCRTQLWVCLNGG